MPKEKVLAGLRQIHSEMPQTATLQIIQDKHGNLLLNIQERGIHNHKSMDVKIYGAGMNPRVQLIHAKLMKLVDLINDLHKEDPKNPLFVPGETDKD